MERSRIYKILWLGVMLSVLAFCLFWGREPTKKEQEILWNSPTPTVSATVPVVQVFLPSLPTQTPAPAPTLPVEEPFCLFWFSDTQVYSYKYPEVFRSMADWAVEQAEAYGALAVVHTGDIVDNHTYERHWTNAESAIIRLDGKLPFFCVAGNHDVGASEPNYEAYRTYGFCSRKDRSHTFRDGVCWWEAFETQKLLLLGIGWQTGEDYLPWAEEVLNRFSDHSVVVLVHSFLTDEGELTGTGKKLEASLLQEHENVRLVLCGHNDGSTQWQKTYEDGRTVHALMYNFQDDKKHGLGYLRILLFDPVTREIDVTTYSPYLDDYNYYADASRDTFTLTDAF